MAAVPHGDEDSVDYTSEHRPNHSCISITNTSNTSMVLVVFTLIAAVIVLLTGFLAECIPSLGDGAITPIDFIPYVILNSSHSNADI
jgi:nitric oxide reductase large subunit